MKTGFIIGGASSIWMKEYIKNIHYKENDKIYLTTFTQISDELIEQYRGMGVEIIQLGKSRTPISQLVKACRLCIFSIKHRIKGDIDFLEVHSPPHSVQAYFINIAIRILKLKTITTFWGSDILRVDSHGAKKLEKIIKKSSVLNVGTEGMREIFRKHYGTKYDDRFVSAKFGSLAFEPIKGIKENSSKGACKKEIGVSEQKISIAIGYNGEKSQQHLEALEALSKIEKNNKDKISLIIHLGEDQGEDNKKSYFEQIEMLAQKSGIEHKIIKKSFSIEQVAVLRMGTDILLHAQKTDALSSTIRECIYAEAILINPSWIKYKEYDALGVEYIEYVEFDEIPQLIEDIIYGKIGLDTVKNARIVYENFSWDAVRKDWVRLFYERAH